ncbi:uncoupling protein, partial [Haematococcus lacustris]
DFKGEAPLLIKIAAGLTTGALGIMVASPTDLVKVRMQSEGKLAPGVPRKYPSALAAYGIIGGGRGRAVERRWAQHCAQRLDQCRGAGLL